MVADLSPGLFSCPRSLCPRPTKGQPSACLARTAVSRQVRATAGISRQEISPELHSFFSTTAAAARTGATATAAAGIAGWSDHDLLRRVMAATAGPRAGALGVRRSQDCSGVAPRASLEALLRGGRFHRLWPFRRRRYRSFGASGGGAGGELSLGRPTWGAVTGSAGNFGFTFGPGLRFAFSSDLELAAGCRHEQRLAIRSRNCWPQPERDPLLRSSMACPNSPRNSEEH